MKISHVPTQKKQIGTFDVNPNDNSKRFYVKEGIDKVLAFYIHADGVTSFQRLLGSPENYAKTPLYEGDLTVTF